MKKFALNLIRWYQNFPTNLHFSCRFNPTCSEYTYQAIDKYGILKGVLMGTWRILHCHPFDHG